ncbi:hypothetical protein [Streptomyces sp. NPDC005283]|uniref:hypothetical protein n=1 Tax=Streptomyces sp. NPDC005283 TaxID=3156871 RepID=UPI003451B919
MCRAVRRRGRGLFLGRVLLALALDPAGAGRSAVADGRFVDCGRARGYAQSRLSELRELAEYARARGLRVTWADQARGG